MGGGGGMVNRRVTVSYFATRLVHVIALHPRIRICVVRDL
jgi:hypothetical protein